MTADLLESPAQPPPPAPEVKLPPLRGTLGVYDGPTSDDGMERHAVLFATARCAMHPLYRRSPGDCLTLLYRAKALNIPVGVALDHVYINTAVGRAGLSAQLMAALLRRSGVDWEMAQETDQVVEFWFYWGEESLARLARWRRTRRGRRPEPRGKAKWTIREAVTAHLTKREHWQLWPVDCLWARAMARGCRRHFSDLVMGMGYTPEELFDMSEAEAAPEEVEQIDPEVQEFLDQADSESATADLIRADIMARARKAKLLKKTLPDGRTLEQALTDVWRVKTAREAAARADAALSAAGTEPADVELPAVLAATAGDGDLHCGCPSAAVLSGDGHLATCKDANVRA